ncbi:hypothetical protein [Prosthecobacter sp.]|uniref:hypothetical protein n=1 Tax=Prosthecobacter sp. TaxID=1965333 RepID=UPI00248721DB|nr:hypothetical protein [Prosthecobacter sp.]MDI1314030.1 hypothetical protein [Prosthecobacter sp.]
MQQNWSIRSRAHTCAVTGRSFEDGESFHTTIFFDPEENGYVRRDICAEAWSQEVEKRKPVAAWKTVYSRVLAEAKPEITAKEGAQALLQRFIEEGDPRTENARYILALMLERKRQLHQTAEKEIDGAKMLFYENRKTGEIFIVRDPELKLSEIADMQDEVATLLAFGGPAADAAKAVGVTLTVDGVVPAPDGDAAQETDGAAPAPPADEAEPEATEESESYSEEPEIEPEADEAAVESEAEPDSEVETDEETFSDSDANGDATESSNEHPASSH